MGKKAPKIKLHANGPTIVEQARKKGVVAACGATPLEVVDRLWSIARELHAFRVASDSELKCLKWRLNKRIHVAPVDPAKAQGGGE